MKGKIICIEGSDRVGKHTQSMMLADYIRGYGYDVKTLSFPNYGTEQAKPVESYLAGNFNMLDPMEASMLYAFDRSVTFREMNIRSFLREGGVLILDRYTTSNVVFQIARSINEENKIDVRSNKAFELIYKIEKLEYGFLNLPRPDAVIYLKLDRDIQKQLLKDDETIKGVGSIDIHESNEKLLDRVSVIGVQLASICGWNIVECYDEKNNSMFSKEEILQKIVNELSDDF